MKNAGDGELVRRILSGDREAGNRWVEDHRPSIRRLLRELTGSAEAAEDLAQQTFLKAWQGLKEFRGAASLRTWLHRIAYHEYTRWLRGRREHLPLGDLPHPGPSPSVVLDSLVTGRALAQLSPRHREAVVLHYLQDLAVAEVAEVLGIPPGTVKSRLYTARDRLRELLDTPEEALIRMRHAQEAVDAAITGNVKALDALLKKDPELLHAEDEWGHPLLLIAARYGYSGRTTKSRAAVELILRFAGGGDIFEAAFLNMPERAAELLAADPKLARAAKSGTGWHEGWTPLHFAAERGALEVVRLLLDHGADPNARNGRGVPPISLAAHAGPMKARAAEDVIQLLEARGARVDLVLAATLGDTDRIGRLLDADPEQVNLPDEEGGTALYHAARNLHLKTVRVLLKRGADPNARRADGQTAVSAAVGHMWDRGGPEVVRALRKGGAVLDLYEAARLGDRDRVAQILAAEPAQVRMTRWGETALEAAAWLGYTEIGRMLLAAGAELTLPVAVALGLEEEVRRLLRAEPGLVHAAGPNGGHTPLHRATTAGQAGMVPLLALHGADLNARTEWGATALLLAADPWNRPPRPSDAEVARALLERGADPNIPEAHHGSTALHAAVHAGNVEVARALLAQGADRAIRDKYGSTPLEMAEKQKKAEMAELLRAG